MAGMKSYKSLSTEQRMCCWTAALSLILICLLPFGTLHHVLGWTTSLMLLGSLFLLVFSASRHNSN